MISERQIRTKAWFHKIKIDIGCTNASQVGSFMRKHPKWGQDDPDAKDISRIWGYYSNLEKLPTNSTLQRIDKIIEGTLDTFNEGPENTSLFSAMFDELSENLFSDDFYKDYGWIITIASEVDDSINQRFSNTIKIFNSMIETDSLSTGLPEISAKGTVNFLEGCLFVFRDVIENEDSGDKEISDAFQLICSALQHPDIRLALKRSGLYEELKMWLAREIHPILMDIHRTTPIENSIKIDVNDNISKYLECVAQTLEERHNFWEWLNEGNAALKTDYDMYGLNERLKSRSY